MKKREAVLYTIYVVTLLVVYISGLINEAVYHVCHLGGLEWTASWHALRVVQMITVPPTAGLLMFSLYCKFRRIRPLQSLPLKRKKRIESMLKVFAFSFFFLYFATTVPISKPGYSFEVYRLARAHGFLLIGLIFTLSWIAVFLGVMDWNKRQ